MSKGNSPQQPGWVSFNQMKGLRSKTQISVRKKISPSQPHNHLSELLATNPFIYLHKPAGDYVYVYRILYIYIYIKSPTSCLSGRPYVIKST